MMSHIKKKDKCIIACVIHNPLKYKDPEQQLRLGGY